MVKNLEKEGHFLTRQGKIIKRNKKEKDLKRDLKRDIPSRKLGKQSGQDALFDARNELS